MTRDTKIPHDDGMNFFLRNPTTGAMEAFSDQEIGDGADASNSSGAGWDRFIEYFLGQVAASASARLAENEDDEDDSGLDGDRNRP